MVMFGKSDVYDKLTYKLRFTESRTLRRIFELSCTPEEAQVLAELPAPSDEIARKLNRGKETVDNQIEDLFQKGLLRTRLTPDGQRQYSLITPVEPLCDEMMRVIGAHHFNEGTRTIEGETNREIADLWHKFCEEEWYRWERVDELVHRRVAMVGTGSTFAVMPAWKALEKSGCDIPEPIWDARQVARGAKRIVVTACSCRVRARNCDLPIWTCTVFGIERTSQAFELFDRKGVGTDYSSEQWLEAMGRCEDLGMVHIGMLPYAPFCCTCDTCCCNIMVPLKRYAKPSEGLNKSPYRGIVNQALCEGCPDCVAVCRFEAIKIRKDPAAGKRKASVDAEKCFGCGQCVIRCQVVGALRLELADKMVPVSLSQS